MPTHVRRKRVVRLLSMLLMFTAAGIARGDDFDRQWAVMHDPNVDYAQRAAAAKELSENCQAKPLPFLFESLQSPVLSGRMVPLPSYWISTYPRVGIPDADARLPIPAQISYFRLDVWKAHATTALPVEERTRILATLFDEVRSGFQMVLLLRAVNARLENWTPETEREVARVFDKIPEYDYITGELLVYRNPDAFYEKVLARAQKMKGTDIGYALIAKLRYCRVTRPEGQPYDTRLAVLMIDWLRSEEISSVNKIPVARGGASQLEQYFYLRFRPEPTEELPRYSLAWYQTYVQNARDWLQQHENEIRAGTFKYKKR